MERTAAMPLVEQLNGLAARASLQRPVNDQILTPRQLFEWADVNVKSIFCLYVSQDEISQHEELQAAGFANAKTIPGTRENHCFIPVNKSSLKMSRVSEDQLTNFVVASVGHRDLPSQCSAQLQTMNPGQYIACMYDEHWWLGNIITCGSESEPNEIHVKFMHPHGPAASFSWPIRDDECWVPISHVLCAVAPPSTTMSARLYVLPSDLTELISKNCATFLEHARTQI